jgi:hypothetical protein
MTTSVVKPLKQSYLSFSSEIAIINPMRQEYNSLRDGEWSRA